MSNQLAEGSDIITSSGINLAKMTSHCDLRLVASYCLERTKVAPNYAEIFLESSIKKGVGEDELKSEKISQGV